MTLKSDIRAEADRLRSIFETKGATTFEADVLQPAGALLDLYGEDIRARAFVTHDPLRGEMMLRPDFTMPLVRRHTEEALGEARYTYAGEVFRRQEEDPDRASEYLQVGYEVFGATDPAQADAEVFAAFADILGPLNLQASMGDIGLLRSAVEGLETSAARKSALLHHLWRPKRFKALLERFSQSGAQDAARRALLASEAPMAGTALEVGLRSRTEVLERLDALRADADTPPLSAADVAKIDRLLGVRGTAPEALRALDSLSAEHPSIRSAVALLGERLEAIRAHGLDLESIRFEASYGRTTLEYYNGFVFGFSAEARGLPLVATGGRYDALTRAIGGNGVPAVGGVIRPGLTLALGGAV